MAEKKKKKKGGGAVVIVLLLLVLIVLALLYFFGDGLGFGFGGGLGLGEGDSVAVNATVTAEQTAEENAVIVIEINEGKIIFDGTEYGTYEEFEKFFYENDFNGQKFILRDNMAVKSSYDAVKTLLDSFGGNYSEETV